MHQAKLCAFSLVLVLAFSILGVASLKLVALGSGACRGNLLEHWDQLLELER